MKSTSQDNRMAAASSNDASLPSRRRAFTLVELIVVISIVTILIALVIAGVQAVRLSAMRTQCANNLHQIGLGLLKYVDQNSTVPTAAQMESVLVPFMQSSGEVFRCPLATNRSYGYNTCVSRLTPDSDTARIVAMDAKCLAIAFTGSDSPTWNARIDARHRLTMNVLFLGGHVQALVPADLDPYDSSNGGEKVATYWRPSLGCGTSGQDDCTGSADCTTGGGFVGYYYDTTNWTGTPWTRPETTLYFPFGGADLWGIPYSSPNPNSPQPLSYKSTGKLYVDTTDTYTFYMTVDDYGWFTLDNNPVFNQIYGGSRGWTYWWQSSPISLKAGECHDFEMRQTNTGYGPSHVSIMWSNSANTTPRIIPTANLR